MAEKEVDLDDFFAKRDKKKKTGKKKYETTEELAKILGKRTEERKKLEEGKSQYVVEGEGAIPGTTQEDDEWLEQKDDTVDLTGLKVTELILDDDDEEAGAEGKDPEIEGGATDGPWRKRAAAAAAAAAIPAPAPAPVPESAAISREDDEDSKKDEEGRPTSSDGEGFEENGTAEEEGQGGEAMTEAPAADGPAKYVPPSMRKAMEAAAAAGGGGGTGRPSMPTPIDIFAVRPLSEPTPGSGGGGEGGVKGAYVPPGRRAGAGPTSSKPRKSAAAPNINEENFPSLGAS